MLENIMNMLTQIQSHGFGSEYDDCGSQVHTPSKTLVPSIDLDTPDKTWPFGTNAKRPFSGTPTDSAKAKEEEDEHDSEDSILKKAPEAAKTKQRVLPAKQWQKTKVRLARKLFSQNKKRRSSQSQGCSTGSKGCKGGGKAAEQRWRQGSKGGGKASEQRW
jgi:hypothetical protein